MLVSYEHPTFDINGTWDGFEEKARIAFSLENPGSPKEIICGHKRLLIQRNIATVATFERIEVIPAEEPFAIVENTIVRPSAEELADVIMHRMQEGVLAEVNLLEPLIEQTMGHIIIGKLRLCSEAIINSIPMHVASREIS